MELARVTHKGEVHIIEGLETKLLQPSYKGHFTEYVAGPFWTNRRMRRASRK